MPNLRLERILPNWGDVLKEINQAASVGPLDSVRREYIEKLSAHTDRNVICYYSGFLQKPGIAQSSIEDDDKNGLMATIHGLDRKKGLDLLLHTPGGDLAAAESIVDYLRKMFGTDIRAIIPQIAMSAGTMIACSCKQIVMGKQSNIGPIDPQFGGIACHAVIDEFKKALEEVKKDPESIPIWQTIVSKYHPTFLGECEKAIALSSEMTGKWLVTGMLINHENKDEIAENIVKELNDHNKTKTHSRHLNLDAAKQMGLNVLEMETDDVFQDLILTVHHAFMHTIANTTAIKIIENQIGNAVVINAPS